MSHSKEEKTDNDGGDFCRAIKGNAGGEEDTVSFYYSVEIIWGDSLPSGVHFFVIVFTYVH